MKKYGILFFCCALVCLCGGCRSAPALKERLIVRCVGVDRLEKGYRLSVDGFQVKGVESGEENAGESMILQAEGETLTTAVENLRKSTGKSLFFSHNQAIVLGEDTAKEGTEEIFRFFNGNYQSSPDVPVFVAQGTAEKMIAAEGLYPLLEGDPFAPAVYQLGETFLRPSAGVCLPVLRWEEENPVLLGFGMGKEGRLVKELSPEEELGYRTVRGRLDSLYLEEIPAEVRFSASETVIRYKKNEPAPTLSLRVNLRGEIIDEISGWGAVMGEETFRDVTEQCEQSLTRAVEAVLEGSAREFGTDLFALFAQFEEGIAQFSSMSAVEQEAILRNCRFEVTVAVVLRSKTAALGED